MKRKVSQQCDISNPSKKSATDANDCNYRCRLIELLNHYPIRESLASQLFLKDLDALAATSKSTYHVLFPNPGSRLSLQKKMQCDGSGILIRTAHHQKSKFFYEDDCIEHAICGTNDKSHVESQGCVSCSTMTCDECRIHCVYQSIHRPPEEEDELPVYSGFVLLDKQEMGIMSPAHLGMGELGPWKAPYHDQGILDVPVESDTWATPENIEHILDLDLGSKTLNFYETSGAVHPSEVIRALWEVTEQRQRSFCERCFAIEKSQAGSDNHTVCSCTLRKQYLDRWLCLRCYRKEQRSVKEFSRGTEGSRAVQCGCGQSLHLAFVRVLCLWCHGEVLAED